MNDPKPARKRHIVEDSTNNRQALEDTIQALRTAGKLDGIDTARIQIARGLASAVDSMPDNPTLWREYRQAEKALREETNTNADPFEELISSINAEVRDKAKQKTQNPRP